ncbi:MAG: alpha/beta fold hydrolase [Planctomycetota bacterium]|nr:alpha/beta fold hydrolase [Planctomycetota bacterium]
MTTKSLHVEFPSADGQLLAARLEQPGGPPRAQAIFAHCFTCSKDIAAATRISRALAERGIAVLRFDFTGLGNSEGDFGSTNFTSNVQDLTAAADYLRAEHRAPALLVGHSLGGAAVLAAAGTIPEVSAVATLGAPSDPEHVKHLFGDELLQQIRSTGQGALRLGNSEFQIRRQLLEDLESHRLTARIAKLDAALMVMHSPVDAIVDIDHARRIYAAAQHPKNFISLDGADHLLSSRRDSEYVAELLACWSARYLPEAD